MIDMTDADAMTTPILILGGTTESRRLAGLLACADDLSERLAVRLSLAGRTRAPAAQPVPVRVGGFGGIEGLRRYLRTERIALVIDTTHPYAAQISANAAAACAAEGIALLGLRRPEWAWQPGDRWQTVADVAAAAATLAQQPARRVFLALGRQEVEAFTVAPQHTYTIRSVDPVLPRPALPHATYLLGRGPFEEADERALLQGRSIDTIVAKNSGGAATYAKIAAARALGISVLLIARPPLPETASVADADAALTWVRDWVEGSLAEGSLTKDRLAKQPHTPAASGLGGNAPSASAERGE